MCIVVAYVNGINFLVNMLQVIHLPAKTFSYSVVVTDVNFWCETFIFSIMLYSSGYLRSSLYAGSRVHILPLNM